MPVEWSSFFGGFLFGCAFLAALAAWREYRAGQLPRKPTIDWNFDINSVHRGDRVFLLLEKGEKGNGELAVGIIYTKPSQPIDCYWTWGGANSGSDIHEVPIAWAPLPDGWVKALSKRR